MNLYKFTKCFYKLAYEVDGYEDNDTIESFPYYKDEIYSIFINNKIYPKTSDLDDSLIGMGSFNYVFEVKYENKKSVCKITKSKQDFDVMITLSNLKKALPKYAKCFPNIYKYFITKINNITVYIMVVEYLLPIDSSIRKLFNDSLSINTIVDRESLDSLKYKTIKKAKQKFKKLLDINFLTNMVKDFNIKNKYYGFNYISSTQKQKIKNVFEYIYNNFETLIDFTSYIEYVYEPDLSKIEDVLEKNLSKYKILNYNIGNIIELIRQLISGKIIPENYALGTTLAKNYPKIKLFINCLEELRNYGVSWKDLNVQNIMKRSSGELVISDPGLFEI
jgi:hypothetical protein